MRTCCRLTATTLILAAVVTTLAVAEAPYLGNGIKTGEPTQTTITVWTRLTAKPDVSREGIPWPEVGPEREDGNFTFPTPPLPEGKTIDEMAWALPGASGEVQLSYWPVTESNMSTTTPWVGVDDARDFTHHFELTELQPGTRYQCVVEARPANGGSATARVQGGFTTAPDEDTAAAVTFTVVTGQEFWRRDDEKNGHKIYPVMGGLKPDFFVHTGDIVYFDKAGPWCVTKAQARHKWNRMYAMPFQRAFHNEVSSYFLRDDHDTWQNDCWPTMTNNKMGDFTYAEGVDLFFEQVPGPDRHEPWRTIRWGKDLQIWLPEGRDFRSPNTDPDGPDKTIWGAQQLAWFKKSVRESDATFRVLISPTPVVGPDRKTGKNDNHSNEAFTHEGTQLRAFMAEQQMVSVCGDRHWQYETIDPVTGLREFSCGPTSDLHAGGFKEELREPMHQYLNVIGGFLAGTVMRENDQPQLVFRHYNVAGSIVNETILTPESLIEK